MSSIVELSNGYKVSYPCYAATCNTLETLCKERPETVVGLLEKCYNVTNQERFLQFKSILRIYHLIDDKGQVDPDIQAIASTTIKLYYNKELRLVPTFVPSKWTHVYF
jgi:hypothetical protein